MKQRSFAQIVQDIRERCQREERQGFRKIKWRQLRGGGWISEPVFGFVGRAQEKRDGTAVGLLTWTPNMVDHYNCQHKNLKEAIKEIDGKIYDLIASTENEVSGFKEQ